MNSTGDLVGAKLGLVLLGASEFPHFPKGLHLDNPSFRNSARAFQEIMQDDNTLLSGKPTILDLFDSDLAPQNMIRSIRDFLKAETDISDLVLYYCGHGSFLSDRTYFLMIRATEPDSEAFTGMPWRQMRHALEPQLANKRVYIVLDCCFAGRAVTEFQSVALGPLIEEQTFHALPRRGTALVAASAHGDVALAPGEVAFTMFTGALVNAIKNGLRGQARTLSFRDIVTGIRHSLPELYPGRAVLPQIHDPVQPEGDVSATPLFINRAFKQPSQPDATKAEKDTFDFAVSDLKRPLTGTRLAALEALEVLIEQTKSFRFRAKVLEIIGNLDSEDDSKIVVTRARKILQRFAVSPQVGSAEHMREVPAPPRAGLREGEAYGAKDHAVSAIGGSQKTSSTFRVAFKAVSKRDVLAYGVVPGFAAGAALLALWQHLNGILVFGILISVPTMSAYLWAAHKNLPTVRSVITLTLIGLAISLLEAAAAIIGLSWSETISATLVLFLLIKVILLTVPFTLLGWRLFIGLRILR